MLRVQGACNQSRIHELKSLPRSDQLTCEGIKFAVVGFSSAALGLYSVMLFSLFCTNESNPRHIDQMQNLATLFMVAALTVFGIHAIKTHESDVRFFMQQYAQITRNCATGVLSALHSHIRICCSICMVLLVVNALPILLTPKK